MSAAFAYAGVWRIVLALTVGVALLAALVVSRSADAEGPAGDIRLTGAAQVQRIAGVPHLVIDAASDADSAWRLQGDVSVIHRTTTANGDVTIGLGGGYQLAGPDGVQSSGELTGELLPDNSGSLQLVAVDGTVVSTAAFTLEDDGAMTIGLTDPTPVLVPAGSVGSGDEATAPTTNHFWWYVSRASAFTGMALLFTTVCMGLAVRGRYPLLARWRWFDMHQFTALLACGFALVHVFSLLGDQYIGFSLLQPFVPFATEYRPAWVALGVVSLYSLALVTGSFYVRRRIGHRTWRMIHYGTFGLFLATMAHGVLAGTDTGEVWAVLFYWSAAVVVVALTYLRFEASARARGTQRPRADRAWIRPAGTLAATAGEMKGNLQ